MFRVHFIEISRSPYALAAQVHEGLGLQKQHLLSADDASSVTSLELFLLHGGAQTVSQHIYDLKTHIMSRLFILSGGIA